MQDLGLGRRVMKGEGEFYGAGAYEEFKKLASVFYHSGPGTLIHPVWPVSYTHLDVYKRQGLPAAESPH